MLQFSYTGLLSSPPGPFDCILSVVTSSWFIFFDIYGHNKWLEFYVVAFHRLCLHFYFIFS